jgi:hypothetical protein
LLLEYGYQRVAAMTKIALKLVFQNVGPELRADNLGVDFTLPQTILTNLQLTTVPLRTSLIQQIVSSAHENNGALPAIHLPEKVASKLHHRLAAASRLRKREDESSSESVMLWLYER